MKRKWPFEWNTLLIIFLLVGILVNNQLIKQFGDIRVSQQNTPVYQVAMILKDSEDPFWKQFKNGADKAATFYQISLDLTYLQARGQKKSPFEISQLLDKARNANADGIISFISDARNAAPIIDQAANESIPTVTMENDVPNSKRASFVGYNAYRFGQEAGKQMTEALAGKGKVAIIMNRNETSEQDSQNLKISGFLNEINKNKDMEVTEYIISDVGIYGTQDIVEKLINAQVPLDGLFITNAVDTESVAQLLVEYNRVGAFQVVGAGNSDEIMKDVDKKIIYASVYVNAYEMGYKCVETIAKIKQGQAVPSYIDTTIGVLSSEDSTLNPKK